MNEFVLVDLLFMALAIGAAWVAHILAPPPLNEARNNVPRPLLAAGTDLVAWTGIALDTRKPPRPLDEILRRICTASGYRDIEVFLEGARLAYEEITDAFARGSLSAQRHLLSKPVYEIFEEAITQRTARDETVERTFIGIGGCDILDAGLGNGQAWIDVRFVGVMVSVTKNAAGDIVAGHPNRVVEVTEVWTFERDLRAAEPRWLLTATEEDE